MDKHKTPWVVRCDGTRYDVLDANGKHLLTVSQGAIAHFLVDCVNALAGREPEVVAEALEWMEHQFAISPNGTMHVFNDYDRAVQLISRLRQPKGGQTNVPE